MNYYKNHIGDYASATAHLNFVEDAAYSRMLRIYYRDERPLPPDEDTVIRLTGARSRAEKQAVKNILHEFFILQEDGWHSKRADEEIAKYKAQAIVNRRIAEQREHNKKSTNRARTVLNPCNGSLPDREPNHKPITNTSEANASAALAARPVPGGQPSLPIEPDPIFGTGLAMLVAKGASEKSARSFLGLLRRDVGDLAAAELLAEVERADITQPIPWLRRAADARKTGKAGGRSGMVRAVGGKDYGIGPDGRF